MTTPREESGFALVSALLMLFILTGLGAGLLFLTDGQQRASAKEQAGEAAFNVAEGALNAQTGQLSHVWPSKESLALPPACTASTTTATNGCPTAKILEASYPNIGSPSCSAPVDAWGSAPSNGWTTYVRDDGPLNGPPTTLFNSAAARSYPSWDANGDGKVWVRSVGVVQCRVVSVLSLVTEQLISMPFPESALAGNWFATSNEGNKVIINTLGEAAQPGGVSMRCAGRTPATCKEYREGQVKPDTTGVAASPSPTLTEAQLAALKSTAKAMNQYYPSGTCPTNLSELAGEPVYVEGPCALSYTGNTQANTKEVPGFLVIANGTLALNAGALFYGTVYAVNKQESSGVVVEVHGQAKVIGSIIVDGLGGIGFGSSGGKGGGEENENYVYNPLAAKNLKTFVGAAGTRNSFRLLPVNQ